MNQKISTCKNWKLYGNPNASTYIAGHSHTFAMYMALLENPDFEEDFAFITHADFHNPSQHDSSYWDFVAMFSDDKRIGISWNGNQHNIHFLIDAEYQFNSYRFQNGKNFPYVSTSRIENLFRPTFFELELVLDRILNKQNIYLLGTPQPKTQNFMKHYLKKDSYFIELGQQMGLDRVSPSSNNLRRFMWETTQRLTARTAKNLGCSFIPAPTSVVDSEGMLLDEFCGEDLTHANSKYGLIMLNEIKRFVGA